MKTWIKYALLAIATIVILSVLAYFFWYVFLFVIIGLFVIVDAFGG